MQQLNDSVINYLDLPKTNYAIQINGAWGIGKTYYIEEILTDIIKNKYENANNEYRVCYVSLNGLSTVEQIGEAVFLELANAKNKLAVQGFKMLGKYGGAFTSFAGPFKDFGDQILNDFSSATSEKLKNKTTSFLSNHVIIFDDLERISDNLSIKEVFGYVYTNYIEDQYAKIIFVSNDEEISGKSEYKLVKEKIIGRTLTFKQPSPNIIEEIINRVYKEQLNFINFFVDNKKEILEAIHFVLPELNLRTIRFVFDTFNILYNQTKDIIDDIDLFKKIMQTVFLNILIVSEEYKKGNIESVSQLSFAHEQRIYFTKYLNKKNNEETFESQFINRYSKVNQFVNIDSYYFESITQFIINGYINKEDYNRQILSYYEMKIKLYGSNSSSNPMSILKQFNSFDELDVKNAQKTVLTKVKNGEYSANEYLEVYELISFFEEVDIFLIDENKDDAFKIGFEIALEKWSPEVNDFYYSGQVLKEENRSLLFEMKNALSQKYEKIILTKKNENVANWLKEIISEEFDPNSFNKIEQIDNLFKIFVDLKVVEKYIACYRTFSYYLSGFLNQKYLRISNAEDFYSQDLPYIDNFIEQIELLLSENNLDKIFVYNINELLQRVKKIKHHISL